MANKKHGKICPNTEKKIYYFIRILTFVRIVQSRTTLFSFTTLKCIKRITYVEYTLELQGKKLYTLCLRCAFEKITYNYTFFCNSCEILVDKM